MRIASRDPGGSHPASSERPLLLATGACGRRLPILFVISPPSAETTVENHRHHPRWDERNGRTCSSRRCITVRLEQFALSVGGSGSETIRTARLHRLGTGSQTATTKADRSSRAATLAVTDRTLCAYSRPLPRSERSSRSASSSRLGVGPSRKRSRALGTQAGVAWELLRNGDSNPAVTDGLTGTTNGRHGLRTRRCGPHISRPCARTATTTRSAITPGATA